MATLVPGLLILTLVLLLSIQATKRFFRIDSLLAFALSPLLLVALSSTVHYGMLELHIDSLTFLSSSRVAIVFWFLYCVFGYVVPKRREEDEAIGETYLTFMACSLSVGAWIIGMGTSSNHPTDNDALSNAFLLRRFVNIQNSELCMVPGDVSRLINMRFESCGAHILAHYSNFFSWAPWDKVLNSTYLLSALFLPIGAAASWKYFSDKPNHRWIAAATSTTFLVYPYALNGLSRLTLGLAFVLPLVGFCSSIEKRDFRQSTLIALSLVGLGYIHLLALTIVAVYLAVVLVFKFLIIPTDTSTVTSPALRACSLFVRAGIVLPAYWFFGLNFAISSTVSNVMTATEVISPSNLGPLGSAGSTLASSSHSPGATTVLKYLFLGSDWTRAQPLVFGLFISGIFILFRRGLSNVPLLLSGLAAYSLFLSTSIWDTHLRLFHFLFLNNWYRLYSVMVIFCVIPVAISVSHFVALSSRTKRRRILPAIFLMAYTLSLATGASIVKTAWSRESQPSAQILNQFDGLKKFVNHRTLNDPKDGSSWAYSRSGIKLLSPNDRPADVEIAKNIDLLVNERSRISVCPFLRDQEVTAVLAVGDSTKKIEMLLRAGVLDRIAFESNDVKLGLLNQNFLSTCLTITDK